MLIRRSLRETREHPGQLSDGCGWLAGGHRGARGPCPGDAGSGRSVQWTVSPPTSYPKTKTSSHELPRQVGQKTAGRGSPSPAPASLRAEGGAGQPHVVPRPQLCSSNAYSPRRFSSPYRVPESRQPLARLPHILVSTVTSVLFTPRLPTFTAQHKEGSERWNHLACLRLESRPYVQPLWKRVWILLKKSERELPYDPEVPLLGIDPEKTNTLIRKDRHAS